MTAERILPALALASLAVAGFVWFPGHTWLQSDTQIYAPILERLRDPAALARDPIAVHAHVTWTVYDEASLALRAILPFDWKGVLLFQQILFRFLGILGAYLLIRSLDLGVLPSLAAAGCFALGAVVNGPAVLTFEYEPVPRGFAVMLLLLALGLGAQHRWKPAILTIAAATLYHPTTTAPVWAAMLLLSLWMKEIRRPLLLAVASSAALLALSAWLGPGARESQPWFGTIDPALEQVQRLRGAYNWIEQWPRDWFWQYFILFPLVLLALRRLDGHLPHLASRWILILSALALASVPLQWLLLDKLKWILIPQFQPARAVLFLTVFAVLLGAACGWRAAARPGIGWLEAAAWFSVVYALPANGLLVSDQWARERAAVVLLLAFVSTAAAWLSARRPGALSAAFACLAIAAPFLLIPTLGRVRNHPALHSQDLDQLAVWAASQTSADSVFLFPTTHRRLEPGIFRVKASRALYVDWKGGGQVNIMPRLGMEWWRRWTAVNQAKAPLAPVSQYHRMGIDYLVMPASERPRGMAPVFENAAWAVVPVQP